MEEYTWGQIDGSVRYGNKLNKPMLVLIITFVVIGALFAVAFIVLLIIGAVMNFMGSDVRVYLCGLIASFGFSLIFGGIGLLYLVRHCKLKRNFYLSLKRGELRRTIARMKLVRASSFFGRGVPVYCFRCRIDGVRFSLCGAYNFHKYKFKLENYVSVLYSQSARDLFILTEE